MSDTKTNLSINITVASAILYVPWTLKKHQSFRSTEEVILEASVLEALNLLLVLEALNLLLNSVLEALKK